jgi:CDP-glycerol glycerophosphotransferase (TagB/SpsB family)
MLMKFSIKSMLGIFLSRFLDLLFQILRIPCSNAIVINSYPEFEDQGFAISLEAYRRNIPTYILVNQINEETLKIARQYKAQAVKKYSLRAICLVKTAKYVFFTHGYMLASTWRKHQRTINLWHGTPLKNVGYSDGRKIQESTYLVTESHYSFLAEGMFKPGSKIPKLLPLGLPRNDFLEKRHIPLEGEKTFLWVPTYRISDRGDRRIDGDPSYGGLGITREDLIQFDELLHFAGIKVQIKFHPMSAPTDFPALKNITRFPETTGDGRFYYGLNLYQGVITDYSSILFDFVKTSRPVFIFAKDLDTYKLNRGLNLDIELDLSLSVFRDVTSLTTALREYLENSAQHLIEEENNDFTQTSSSRILDYLETHD